MINFANVNQLERHIEILLLSNDCVMVPGLGGFMTHYVCSSYSEKDHQMYPPLRTLGFNPKLKANDNLLAQSYVEAFDISYPEAMQRIEDEVGELSERLYNDGSFTLNDIGTLTVNEEGNIEFVPVKAGLLTPELYALDSIEVKMLSEMSQSKSSEIIADTSKKEKAQVVDINTTSNHDDAASVVVDDGDSIKIKLSLIRNVAAVAIAIIGFFLFTSPLANGNYKMNMSNINTDMLYQIMPKTMVTEGAKDAEPVMANNNATDISKNADAHNVTTTSQIKEQTITAPVVKNETKVSGDKKTYCLVMASHISKANGETFLMAVHKDGFTNARMTESKGNLKIIYGEYDSETKAYEELRSLHSNKYFKQAWVMEIKG